MGALATAAIIAGCGALGGDDNSTTEALIGETDSSVATSESVATSALDQAQPNDTTVLTVTTAPNDADTTEQAAGPSSSTDDTNSTDSTSPTSSTDLSDDTSTSMGADTTAPPATTTSTSSAIVTTSGPTTAATPSSSSATTTAASEGCSLTTTACVGPGEQYATLAAAVADADDGAVIELLDERYNETVAVTADAVTIRSGLDGRSIIDCSGLRPAQGKACILAVGTDLTVENVVVTGARGPDDNEACFRNEPGTRFTVRNVECFGSNNGILGSGGSWLIEDSYFYDNGAGDGFSHNLYLSGDCSEVVFRRSISERANGGHAFKSRCSTSVIDGSVLRDNDVGDAAEFSWGGSVTIRDSTLYQPDGANGNIVRHGAEGCRHGGRLTFIDAIISSDRAPGYIRSECDGVDFDSTQLPSGINVVVP